MDYRTCIPESGTGGCQGNSFPQRAFGTHPARTCNKEIGCAHDSCRPGSAPAGKAVKDTQESPNPPGFEVPGRQESPVLDRVAVSGGQESSNLDRVTVSTVWKVLILTEWQFRRRGKF